MIIKSIKEFIIDEGVFGDVAFDADICQIFQNEPANNHGDEDSHENVLCHDVPNVHHVDSVHQKQKLMPTHQHVRKLVPVVLEKYWQPPNKLCIQRAVYYLLQKGLLLYIKLRCLHSFEVILETLQHVVLNELYLCVILFIEHVRDGFREY